MDGIVSAVDILLGSLMVEWRTLQDIKRYPNLFASYLALYISSGIKDYMFWYYYY
jgi:hypothetical protein